MNPRTTLCLALAACLAAAGCTSSPAASSSARAAHATSTFTATAAGHAAWTASVPFDAAARPAESLYAQHAVAHPDYYNALDQLVDAAPLAHVTFNVTFDPKYGPFLADIAGLHPADAYWILSVDGVASEVGMQEVHVQAGQRLSWALTPSSEGSPSGSSGASLSAQPSAAGARGLTLAPIAPTKEASVVVHGSGGMGAVALVVRNHGNQSIVQATRDGTAWSATVPLAFGESTLDASAADGSHATATAVRLAKATLQVKYTAQPTHSDSSDDVWFDLDNQTSKPLYQGKDVQHPDKFTVHDLMRVWEASTGNTVTYEYHSGLGYAPIQFDGVGNPLGLGSTAPPYWCYKLDGATADFGISLQQVQPGQTVTWEYAGCA